MRKFVNKNRRKRKYTRKNVGSSSLSSFSFYDLTIIGLIPLIFAILGFLTILFRQPQHPFSLPQHVPQITFSSNWDRSISSLIEVLGTLLSSIGKVFDSSWTVMTKTIYPITHKTPDISFDFHALQLIQRFISTTSKSVIDSAAWLYVSGSNAIMHSLQFILQLITSFAELLFHFILALIYGASAGLRVAAVAVLSICKTIFLWTTSLFSAIWHAITFPFFVLFAYLERFRPVYSSIGKVLHHAFEESLYEINKGIADLFDVSSVLAKSNP